VSTEIVTSIGIVVCSVAIVANSFVTVVLMRARREFGSSVHTLITNQSAMDLFASVSAVLSFITQLTHGYDYKGNKILDGSICVLLEGGGFVVVGLTAEKIGLIVITLERYFKIVHAIAHRKHYRNWMTSVGVALPWIGAVCLILFPAMGTTRIVNGKCLRMGVWPNKAMERVSYIIFVSYSYNVLMCFCYY